MRSAALLIVLAGGSLTTMACSSAAACDDDACPTDQVCHSERRRCVTDLPPVITVAEPVTAQMVTAREVVVRGTVFDESGAATAEVRIVPAVAWRAVDVGANGEFSLTLPLPLANDALTTIEVRASDPAGKRTVVQREFFVDNVSPAASLTLRRPSGRFPVNTALQFSEPIASAGTITVSPEATGVWNEARDQYLLSLQPNTAYTLTVDPPDSMKDAAGNVAVDIPSTFTTEPASASPGRIILQDLQDPASPAPIGSFAAFDAAADRDGVITLAVRYGGSNRLQWGRFSPTTGAFEVFQDIPASNIASFRVYALLPSADRLDLRTSVLVTTSSDGTPIHRATAKIEGRPLEGSGDDARAALPGTPCAPAAAPALGFVLDGAQDLLVARLPVGADLPLALMDAPLFAHASAERWSVFNIEPSSTNSELRHQQLECACAEPLCALSPRATLVENVVTTLDPPSVASTADGHYTIALADRASGDRAEACVDCSAPPCTAVVANRSRLARRVAVGAESNQLIAAQKTDDTVGVQIFERRFTGCIEDAVNQWSNVVQSVPGTPGIDRHNFRPLMVGSRPGVMYLNPASELHLYAAP